MLGPLNVNLADFNVSSQNGFLPTSLPLEKLTHLYYASWEETLDELPALLNSRNLKNRVDRLDVLSTAYLELESEWRRAYLLLSFLTHAYIWQPGGPSERLPPSITVPFLDIANHLELPTTATYAALNLWNFKTLSSTADLTDLDNLRVLNTFTGTEDEEWFYLVSVAIEARGAQAITYMLRAMDAVRTNNSEAVCEALVQLSQIIQNIGVVLRRMYEKCSPDVFYNEIRPFLAGSKTMSAAGLPNGVFYDEGDGRGEWRQYSGGSNAQSSLIQFFDVVLGVKHLPTEGKGGKHGFLKEMRRYMPGPHARFIEHIESTSNIREFVEGHPSLELSEAYSIALIELGKFRDIHIQIVTRYIINPSRKVGSGGKSGLNIAIVSSNKGSTKGLQGTGGTELLPFLKQSRDETNRTVLD